MRKFAVALAIITGGLGSAVSDAAAVQCDYDVIVLVYGNYRGYAVFPNTSSECVPVSAAITPILNSSVVYLKAQNMASVCARIDIDKPWYGTVTPGPCAPPVRTKPVDATSTDTSARPVEPAPMGR